MSILAGLWPQPLLADLAAATFFVGAMMNFFAPPAFIQSYVRWGYPRWWNYVTGLLDLLGAGLLLFPATRVAGAIVLILVIGAAILTLLFHREAKSVPPALLLLAVAGAALV